MQENHRLPFAVYAMGNTGAADESMLIDEVGHEGNSSFFFPKA